MEQERWEIRATSCAALKAAERAREGNILGKYTQRGRDPVLQGTAAKIQKRGPSGAKGSMVTQTQPGLERSPCDLLLVRA